MIIYRSKVRSEGIFAGRTFFIEERENRMKITDILKTKRSFSLEVFPPKEAEGLAAMKDTLSRLAGLKPDFISCTYGAGGTTRGKTEEVCRAIKMLEIPSAAHLTCIGNTEEDIRKQTLAFKDVGVENILALRGDLPEGFSGTEGDFQHADQLVAFLKENFPEICIGVACYPETHVEAESPEADIRYLKGKVQAGASYLTTQLCYDVESYERFREHLAAEGVDAPVVCGIMPVLNRDGLIRMTSGNGCHIPGDLGALVEKYGEHRQDFLKAGKEYTVGLIERFVDAGVEGIHIYSLNKYQDVADIIQASNIRI